MPIYNKLIRDKIPGIIAKSGQRATIRTLNDDEFVQELEKKLQEEVAEYLQDKNADELADILEVVYALSKRHGHTPQLLEELRKKKAEARGRFDEQLFLMEVAEES